MKKIKTWNSFNKKLNESISRTYDEFLIDLKDELKKFNSTMSDDSISEFIDYYHGKSWLFDMWENGFSPKEAIQNIKDEKNTLNWFK